MDSQHFKKVFYSLIHFLRDSIIRNKDKDKYIDFARDLYAHGCMDDDTMKDLVADYSSKPKNSIEKEKDDYER